MLHELHSLYLRLDDGAQARIARRTGKSKSAVAQVVKGRSRSEEITAAIKEEVAGIRRRLKYRLVPKRPKKPKGGDA